MKQLNLKNSQIYLRNKFLKSGVKMVGPETIFFSNDTQIGKNVVIEPYVVIGSKVKIGNNVVIKSFSHLESCQIENKVEIGSYIGDTLIGTNSNIGAGTITCNYDGKKKYVTNIKDKVFIGSNSSLVAPITIGEGSTIGAGSVITKNVKRKSLALTRSLQTEIKNYKRKSK